MEREFTLDEANALLPELITRVSRLQSAHEALLRASAAGDTHAGNGTGSGAAAQAAAQQEFEAALAAVTDLDVVVRDAGTGIIDFPAQRAGEAVYLCWQPGEDSVGHWHDRAGGFAGRQPL
ncbi:MAG: DUF2203 domain-containing protein [Candidatus Dormibacteraeota bacterium]|nr:DUF2203 domain-containing protein [Candidatus Dormibacteraeota bacterium]